MTMVSYAQFFDLVKKSLSRNLASYELTPEEIDQYMKTEEKQVQGAYKGYSQGCPDGMTWEAHLKSSVSGVAMCLEYCY